ncbi:MAG: hypothetical protein BVN28_07750 [Nitrospira sp. ST-bin4]|jgi:hypothetical protein|nr:MAG: hypothetical protein BVN28_07750 [Nitrospira sp. ST-bin4]
MEDTQRLLNVIQRKYKSFEEPEFWFVSKMISSQPYAPMVSHLQKLFTVQETTDPNDDVSFVYTLSKSRREWLLQLSMVDRYAVVLRGLDPVGCTFVSWDSPTPEEQALRELLQVHHFTILDQQTLEQPCPLKMHNTDPENMCIYQALFSDVDVLPWETAKRHEEKKEK